MSGILVLGAGGHAKVVADILLSQGEQVLGFLDDDHSTWGTVRLDLPVLGGIDSYKQFAPSGLILGIGANQARRSIMNRLGTDVAELWRNAIHARATVAGSVRVGKAVVIVAGAVVNPDSILRDGVIINTGALVDHDCEVGAYAHVAPGGRLTGGVIIGAGALVGAGATVLPGRKVGAWSTVGAGAVVVRDVPDGVVARGVPARW